MEKDFRREELILERTELQRQNELIRSIISTKEELQSNNNNFENAEMELVDFYIYQIKANQAKLSYLLKLAKAYGITMDVINKVKYNDYNKEIS